MSRDTVRAIIDAAPEIKSEPPRLLMRELPPADPYPVEALGDVLAPAARAIHDRVQAPLAICAQSVLAAVTLATQAHADVVLPTGHARPQSIYLVTVAATGERKSAVDAEACGAVRRRCERHMDQRPSRLATRSKPGRQHAALPSSAARVIAMRSGLRSMCSAPSRPGLDPAAHLPRADL
jgi:hypothetical protein